MFWKFACTLPLDHTHGPPELLSEMFRLIHDPITSSCNAPIYLASQMKMNRPVGELTFMLGAVALPHGDQLAPTLDTVKLGD
jgi:hypothetical protein